MALDKQAALRDLTNALLEVGVGPNFQGVEIGEDEAIVEYTPVNDETVDIKIRIEETTERRAGTEASA